MPIALQETTAADVSRQGRQAEAPAYRALVERLRRKQRGTQVKSFAQDIGGVSEAMVRAVLNGQSRIGLDTLAALVVWDSDFEAMALAMLRERGRQLRGQS